MLAGVLLKLADTGLTMAATDGFRLAVKTLELPAPVPVAQEVIVPARALVELARIMEDESEVEITITPSGGQVLFHSGSVDLVSRLIDGDTPKTKVALAALRKITQARTVLVVVDENDEVTWLSLRNAVTVHALAVDQLNAYDVLVNDEVVFTSAALESYVSRASHGTLSVETGEPRVTEDVAEPTNAELAARTVVYYVLGFTADEQSRLQWDAAGALSDGQSILTSNPNGRFAFGMRLLVDGMSAQHSASPDDGVDSGVTIPTT